MQKQTNVQFVSSSLRGSFQAVGIARPGGGFPQERVILTFAWTLGSTGITFVPCRNTLWESKKENLLTLKLFKEESNNRGHNRGLIKSAEED